MHFDLIPFSCGNTRAALVAGGDLSNDGKAHLAITADQGSVHAGFRSTRSGFTQRADFFGLISDENKDNTNFR